jgi:O-antigen/teichoic acid export membrane protein
VLGGNLLGRIVSLLTVWILVRHLRPEDFGIFSILDMVAGVSAGLLTTGFNWAMIKSVAALQDDPSKARYIARKVLKIEVIYGLALSLGLFFGAESLAHRFFHKPELVPYLRLGSIGVLGTVLLGYRTSIFQALKQFKLDATFTIGYSVVYLIIILLLLGGGYFEIFPVAVAYVSLPLAISALALLWIKKDLSLGRKGSFPHFFRTMGGSYGWLLCYTLCLWLASQVHFLVLTRYFPLQEVGLYGFAYKIYGIALMLMNAINVVLLPTFAGISDRQALRESFQRVLKGTTVVGLGLLATIPFMGMFVEFFAGSRYLGATGMLQILIFGATTSTILSPPVNVLFALDKFRLIAIGGILLVSVNVIGNLTITKHYGGTGAALVQMVSFLVVCVWGAYHSFRLLYRQGESLP